MSNFITMFVVVASLGVLVQSMHIHPRRGDVHDDGDVILTDAGHLERESNEILIDTKDIQAARYVPLNSVFFFKMSSPCPNEGYQRDLLGICREIW